MELDLAMKKLLLTLVFCLFAPSAWAQCTGVFPNGTLCGNFSGTAAPPQAVLSAGPAVPPATTTSGFLATWLGSNSPQLQNTNPATFTGNIINAGYPPYNLSTSATSAANATALTNAFSDLDALGGGTIVIPTTTSAFTVGCFTIPQHGGSGATAGSQVPFRLTGAAQNTGIGIGNNYPTQAGGPSLDLRCNTSARILTLGIGTLEIDHLSLINKNTGGGDTVPFILTTNTTINVHDNIIIGDTSLLGNANIQDAIQLGNDAVGATPCNTATCRFQGYWPVIVHNSFDHIARALNMIPGNSTNVSGVWFYQNTIGFNTGFVGSAIECNGGTNGCTNNVFQQNYFDFAQVNNYNYGVDLKNGAAFTFGNLFYDNVFSDDNPILGYYHFGPGVVSNVVVCSTCFSGIPTIKTSTATWPGYNSNTFVDPTGVSSAAVFDGPGGYKFTHPILVGRTNQSGEDAFELFSFSSIAWLNGVSPTAACGFRLTQTNHGNGLALDTCSYGSFTDLAVENLYHQIPVVSRTTSYTILGNGGGNQTDNNVLFTNISAGSEIDLTLPANGGNGAGETHHFYVATAQPIKIVVNTGNTIQLNNTAATQATSSFSCSGVGCALTLTNVGVVGGKSMWGATSVVSTWTLN